jgi:hypothetical protein
MQEFYASDNKRRWCVITFIFSFIIIIIIIIIITNGIIIVSVTRMVSAGWWPLIFLEGKE